MTSEQFRHLKTLDELLKKEYEILNYLKQEIKECIGCPELLDIDFYEHRNSRVYIWEGMDDDVLGMQYDIAYSADQMLEEEFIFIDDEEDAK